MAADLVLLGRITKPHGIRGEIKVYPYSGLPENFLAYSRLVLRGGDGLLERSWNVEKARVQKRQVLLKLEGCDSRNEAETLVGREVWIQRADLPAIGEDEFYLHDLLGREVVARDGTVYGVVTGMLATGAHDIARVKQGGREYLVPLVPEFLVSVTEGRIVVDLPPGLLEING